MNLKEQINNEIKTAMKAKDKIRLNVLRYIKKLFIENDTSKKPIAEMDIVIGHAKKIKDSLELYPKGSEQHQTVLAEIKVIEEFMPKQLSTDEVKEIIQNLIKEQDSPNFGSIMKELAPKIKGQFDGKQASSLVKDLLN